MNSLDQQQPVVMRRSVLVGLGATVLWSIAGCIGDDSPVARCSGTGALGGTIKQVIPLQGSEQISLGIVVDEHIPSSDEFGNIVVRNRDGDVVADIPLEDNRHMSETDPAFPDGIRDGALYAVPLGPPPQHGDVTVELVDSDGMVTGNGTMRFNCYAMDGKLP